MSYRALDVEQIGHVYEGLLERTVSRVEELTLALEAGKKAKETRVTLKEVESALAKGKNVLLDLLVERSLRSRPSIERDLTLPVEGPLAAKLLAVCRGDTDLRKRISPFARLLRMDPWGYPLVYSPEAFVVGLGYDRRETGTHYTPKALTERIVEETLIPCVYEGPSEGKPPAEWTLKPPAALVDLKICDPAMGSGAFLVQACRWLGDRLVESWNLAEEGGKVVDLSGNLHSLGEEESGALRNRELLPKGPEERTVLARRSIAERCLYGVDINPMAVELAKLSIWLTTMAKGHPFGFLDHNLKSGDSLLGIEGLDQLVELSPKPKRERQIPLFGRSIKAAVDEALSLRKQLRAIPLRDISDVQAMERLDRHAREKLGIPESIADAFVGIVLSRGGDENLGNHLKNLAAEADRIFGGDSKSLERLVRSSAKNLSSDAPNGQPRRPFHWPLEFPEVFVRPRGGFDAIVGNPPFLGGQRITGALGVKYREWLVDILADGRRGAADLVAYFFLRAFSLLRDEGGFGLLAVNTIAEGDTRQVGLEAMVKMGATIYAAYPNEPWPGSAAVVTSRVHVHKGEWKGQQSLLGKPVPYISPFLSGREEWSPKRLKANEGLAFQGSIVLGMGFVLSHDEAQRMLDADPRNADVILPYLNGEDLNSDPEQKASRWVINFWDWPEERARTYKMPFSWIEERVKPERQRRKNNGTYVLRKPLPERWWQYGEKRPALYHAIGRGHSFERHPKGWDNRQTQQSAVLVCSEVTKHLIFAIVPNTYIFSANLDVFSTAYPIFFICQSTIHELWARKHSSKLETRLKYSPGNAFETFPFPWLSEKLSAEIYTIGKYYLRIRKNIADKKGIGLTNIYNMFHDPSEDDVEIRELRELHRQMDLLIAESYDWGVLKLNHDFYRVPYLSENDCLRFTISEAARIEVLSRLAELNRQRYEGENARSVPDTPSRKSVATKSKSTGRKQKKTSSNIDLEPDRSLASLGLGPTQDITDEPWPAKKEPATSTTSPQKLLLFEEPVPPSAPPAGKELDAEDRILDFLRSNRRWIEKEAILKGTGVPESHWTNAIVNLRDHGLIERQGEGKKARYRAI
ncbi:MAG: Eco57I restriction-modification methylase domain-containing protein [Synergistales bacterium]